jgi:hypothetical protein
MLIVQSGQPPGTRGLPGVARPGPATILIAPQRLPVIGPASGGRDAVPVAAGARDPHPIAIVT